MTDIWTNSMEGWRLESAKAFDDEETLHRMILENPEFLPLAGSPRLTPDYSSCRHKMSKRVRHVESDQRVTGYPQKKAEPPFG